MATRRAPQKNEPPPAWDHTPEPEIKWPGHVPTEELVLGAILIGGAEQFDKAAAIISQEDLLVQKHQIFWRALVQLREANEGIDGHTVAMQLNATAKLSLIDGGLSWVVSLTDRMPDVPHIESYCRKIRELSHRRRLMVEGQTMLARAQDEAVPIDEIVQTASGMFEKIQTGETEEEGKTPEKIIQAMPGFAESGVDVFLDPTLRPAGFKTPWARFNDVTNGIHRRELTILGARPGVGKTAWALNLAHHVATHERVPVWIFSLEMSGFSLLTRLVCAMARVDQHKFRCGFLNYDERRKLQIALAELVELPIVIFDNLGIGGKGLIKQVRKAKDKDRPGIVILDFLQLAATDRAENRNLAVGQLSRELKLLTMDEEIAVVALSQLSRPDKTRRMSPPDLTDLRDSGELEQNSDNCLFLWRQELVAPDRDDVKGKADLIIGKQRNGSLAKCPLYFLPHFGRFENPANDLAEAAEASSW